MDLHANVGDEIVVDAMQLGGHPRVGQILAVVGEGEHIHYRVRWDDDGHESTFFPGSTSHAIHPGERTP